MFSLADYHFLLPEDLIADRACHPAHEARLMVVDRSSGKLLEETTFWNLDRVLAEDRVLFFNDSRVIPARIRLENVTLEKPDGTKVILAEGEIFYLQSHGA